MHLRHLLVATLSALGALRPVPAPHAPGERPPQFLVLSYDATPGPADVRHDLYAQIFHAIREVSHGRGNITLFLNQQFFMLPHDWRPPRGSRWDGHPELYARYLDPQARNLGVLRYPRTPAVIEARIRITQQLAREGIELASHGTRHYDGRAWTEAQWRADFDEYEHFMHDVVGIEAPHGFRAPFLASADPLYAVEAERGMLYDASRAGNSTAMWPRRVHAGVWEFAVPTMYFPRIARAIIAFDDSFRIRHLTEADLDPTYAAEFERRYRGSRAPMLIASHGNYTPPTLRLALRVCRLPDVRCVSYRELAEYMTAHPELEGAWQYTRLRPAS